MVSRFDHLISQDGFHDVKFSYSFSDELAEELVSLLDSSILYYQWLIVLASWLRSLRS